MSFIRGAVMVLSIIMIQSVVAYVQFQNIPGRGEGCTTAMDGTTTCDGSMSFVGFLAAIVTTAATGIVGANIVFNAFYVLILGFILIVGVIECFRSNTPTLPGG